MQNEKDHRYVKAQFHLSFQDVLVIFHRSQFGQPDYLLKKKMKTHFLAASLVIDSIMIVRDFLHFTLKKYV